MANKDDFTVINGAECSAYPPPKRWVIDTILPEGMTVLFGHWGAGKSHVALEMAASIATNTPCFGTYNVRPGVAVFVSLEGDIEPAWYLWCKEHGLLIPEEERQALRHQFHTADDYEAQHRDDCDTDKFYRLQDADELNFSRALRSRSVGRLLIVKGNLALSAPDSVDALAARIDAEVKLFDPKPPVTLITIDTLSRATAGDVDASGEQGMQRLVAGADRLRRHFHPNPAMLLLTHPVKSNDDTMRGSNVLDSDLDAVLRLQIAGNVNPEAAVVPLTLESLKMRQGGSFGKIGLVKRAIPLVSPDEEAEVLRHENEVRRKGGAAPLDVLDHRESCIIELDQQARKGAVTPVAARKAPAPLHAPKAAATNTDRLLSTLIDHGGRVDSRAQWEEWSGVKHGSFHAALKPLLESQVRRDGDGFVLANDATQAA